MKKQKKFNCNLKELDKLTKNLVHNTSLPNVILLDGELGSGKTTLARFFIKNFFLSYKIKPPKFVISPSFPILQLYRIKNFSIYHYDLYRIKNVEELIEMSFEENIENNLTIIEWPEKIKKFISTYNFVNIKISIINEIERQIIINHKILK